MHAQPVDVLEVGDGLGVPSARLGIPLLKAGGTSTEQLFALEWGGKVWVIPFSNQQSLLRAAVQIGEQTAAHQARRVAALEAALTRWRGTPGGTKRATPKAPTAGRPRKQT